MDRNEILATLRALPDEIDGLTAGLSDEQLRRRPSAPTGGRPDEIEWSVLEVCCHLRDSAEIEGLRIRRLVQEDDPTLEPYDQEALARDRNYQGDDIGRVRTAVRAFWGGLAYQLEGLSEADWQRAGTHPEQGPVTVAFRAQRMAEHAREHLAQMRGVRERTA